MTDLRRAEGVAGDERLIDSGDFDMLTREFANAKRMKAMAEETVDVANRAVEQAERRLFDEMETRGLRLIKTPWGTFSLNDLAWPRVVDEKLAREWADENFPEAMTLSRQRLVGVIRTAIKDGMELPPGIEASFSRKISWRQTT